MSLLGPISLPAMGPGLGGLINQPYKPLPTIFNQGTKELPKDMGFNTGNAASGAVKGGTTGAAFGPYGAAAGAVIGGLLEGFGKPSTTSSGGSGGGGLTDAFTSGLGSLIPGFGGGKTGTTNVNQSQAVDQTTGVNVTNILGREFGGGVSADGNFDTALAIGDVFRIRDAMAAANVTQPAAGLSGPLTQEKTNLMPFILIGLAAAAFLLLKKGR